MEATAIVLDKTCKLAMLTAPVFGVAQVPVLKKSFYSETKNKILLSD